jgi:hypothetical protein
VPKKDTQIVEELQAQITHHIPSTDKVEGGQGSAMQGNDTRKEEEIPEVQKEPDSISR